MLRHLQKRRGSDSDSGCDSDTSSARSCSQESHQGSGTDSDVESDSSNSNEQVLRIPPSLLKVLENPIIEPGDKHESSSNDSESEGTTHSEDSASQKLPPHEPQLRRHPICRICPGKQLKTQKLLEEHLMSQAHKRRLERYRDFIENPPPHTSLSPDPSDVIELIDALIGPPPIFSPGSIPKKKKRKKRKLAKNLATGVSQHDQTTDKTKNTRVLQPGSHDPALTKSNKRSRSRRGKRERQEKVEKNLKPKSV